MLLATYEEFECIESALKNTKDFTEQEMNKIRKSLYKIHRQRFKRKLRNDKLIECGEVQEVLFN